MAEKVTFMKLKVDLECEKCFKKVKKLLGKYPQIRAQQFDEKQSTVFITVVCCSPEKIRDKLCYKGGGSIKSIEIVELPKPKAPEPEKKKDDKPKAADPPKKDGGDKPKAAEPEKKKDGGGGEKPKGDAPAPQKDAEKPKTKPTPAMLPAQPHMAAPMAVPVGMLYAPPLCYDGRPVGPCYEYGGPMMHYDGYYARPVYDSYGGNGGGGRPCYVNRCDQYFSEENPQGCAIM